MGVWVAEDVAIHIPTGAQRIKECIVDGLHRGLELRFDNPMKLERLASG